MPYRFVHIAAWILFIVGWIALIGSVFFFSKGMSTPSLWNLPSGIVGIGLIPLGVTMILNGEALKMMVDTANNVHRIAYDTRFQIQLLERAVTALESIAAQATKEEPRND